MKARYGSPDGPERDANNIHSDNPEKPGPWFCVSDGCTVQFKYHRVAAYAHDEPGRVIRNATFAHGDDRGHLAGCYLNAIAMKQRLLANHRDVLSERGDILLLKWGDELRLDTPSGTPQPQRRRNLTREEYAGILKAADDIAQIVDDSDYDDDVLKRYWVRFNGKDYAWKQFCYGPGGEDLHRLVESGDSIANVFNTHVAPWPRMVRAIVAEKATTTDARVYLSLRSVDKYTDRNGKEFYARVRVFAKPNTEAAAQLQSFTAIKQEVFVLGVGEDWALWPTGSNSPTPQIWVSTPAQVSG